MRISNAANCVQSIICLASQPNRAGKLLVCNFDPELFKANFGLSSERYPVAIVSLGYIQEQPDHFTTRKDKDEIVTFL